jgi:hypothetical protein
MKWVYGIPLLGLIINIISVLGFATFLMPTVGSSRTDKRNEGPGERSAGRFKGENLR